MMWVVGADGAENPHDPNIRSILHSYLSMGFYPMQQANIFDKSFGRNKINIILDFHLSQSPIRGDKIFALASKITANVGDIIDICNETTPFTHKQIPFEIVNYLGLWYGQKV